jgi:UDP-2,3-diacylglucosamine hydrolase
MKIVFLSDAHLRDASDANYGRVLAFLDALPADLGRLVVNGDFFDCWYGDNATAEEAHLTVLERFARLRKGGTQITFVEGNHDFRLHKALGKFGIEVVSGEWRPAFEGKRALVVHGDLITGDAWYKLMHFGLRSPLAVGLDLAMPASLSMRIGLGMSTASRVRPRDYEAVVNRKLMDYAAELRDIDVFITGHTHFPLDVTVAGPTGPVRVINLGDWLQNFTYLWVENGLWELRRA